VSAIKKFQITNTKYFDKPFDRLTVLSRVEGLPTLSQPVESLKVERVEWQITKTEIQNSKLDMAAKRRKKHQNKISGLVISMCCNEQKSKF
jgi:hypothetical protein